MINISDLKPNNSKKNDVNKMLDLPEEGELSNDDFEGLIRKMEYQKAQLELGVMFEKNLKLLKRIAPSLYDEYVDYEPEEVQLVLEDDLSINLCNLNTIKNRVYPSEPKEYCKKQVAEYLEHPVVTNISYRKSEPINDDYIHIPIYNNIIESYENLDIKKEVNINVPIGLFMMIGCGLGYQIIELIRKLNIINFCVVEPHKDCFYASLHVIDWNEISDYFLQEGRMLKLFIGPDHAKVEQMIRPLVEAVGLHNVIHTFQYRHLNSEQEKLFTEKYITDYRMSSHGLGFFDDERVSLAHTLAHLSNGFKLFKPIKRPMKKLPPAFIIGNGPSLDDLLPLLEREKDNCIIFSGGSTLGSLYKVGIKPDFHIEMERVKYVRDVIEAGTDEEYRKGIIALGLNTVHPKALDLFDKIGLAKKPNDLGMYILETILKESKPELTRLENCNPTVTNSTLGFVLGMGFTEIYLIGVDFGSREDGSHHSKNSFYVDLEKKGAIPAPDRSVNYDIPGNFSDKVSTIQVLDNSRLNIEQLLDRHNFEVNVYNPNQGAKILGTITIKDENIKIPKIEKNKKELVNNIFQEQFIDINFDEEFATELKKTLSENFLEKTNDLGLLEHPKNIEEAVSELNRVFTHVRRLHTTDPVTTMLIRGSIHTIFTPMYKAFIFTTCQVDFEKAYRIGWLAYEDFLEKASEVMKNTPYQYDRSEAKVLLELTK